MENWKSPRKVEEEIKHYRRSKFEELMQLVDDAIITLDEAIELLGETNE